ncbi:MAG TPA: hypothetical protein VFN42_14055, partial [Acetobacteraceae bacterium]|nr:hypothetical protein [Acetobacteraceae bacterium]
MTARLGAIFGGNAVLFSQDSLSPAAFVFETAGFENRFVASYADHYAATNVWTPGVAVQPDGAIVTGDEIIGRREFEQTEWYNDWLRPQGLYHGTGAVL